MRHKNPELMKKIYDYAEEYYFLEGYSPSTFEIAESLGIAKTTAYNYLVEMNNKGMIEYDGKIIITEKMKKSRNMNRSVGIFDDSISCGSLETVESGISEYVDLPVSIFGKKELYILRTHGESMIDAGIEPGDLVVVEKKNTAVVGNIVVALGNETGNTLKRLERVDDKYVLHPENKTMDDIVVDNLEIQGVARFVIKKL